MRAISWIPVPLAGLKKKNHIGICTLSLFFTIETLFHFLQHCPNKIFKILKHPNIFPYPPISQSRYISKNQGPCVVAQNQVFQLLDTMALLATCRSGPNGAMSMLQPHLAHNN